MHYTDINMAVKNFFFYQNPNPTIRTSVNLNEEQKFWLNHTYRRFSLMKAWRQQSNREDMWKSWQRQYDAWRPPKGMNWQSNIVPPFTTSVIESSLSELVDQNLMPTVKARNNADKPKAEVMNFVNEYAWNRGYGPIELYKAQKQQLITGTTFWQDYYLQEKQKVQILTEYDPKTGREKYKEVEMMNFDDVYGEAVSLWDLWFDPDCRSINIGPYKAQDAIRKYVFHIDVFRQMFVGSRWDKFGLAKHVRPTGRSTDYYQYYQPSLEIDSGSQVEVLFHWIRNPDKLVIVANDIPFYINPKPYNHKLLPFARGVDLLDPWSLYGKGESELLESIQDELTTNRRMRLDQTKMNTYKMIFISNRETVTEQDLVPAPMKPVYVDDIANVKAFEYGDINQSAYREETLLKEDGARVTGIDDRAQSAGATASTATEAAILKESTLKRLRTKIWLTSNTLLTELIQLRVPNIIQFYQMPKIRKIMGEDAIDKWSKIRKVSLEGRLIQHQGQYFEQEYRTISTKNKRLEKNKDNKINIVDDRGEHFFMVTPDVLIPSEEGFIYELGAEPRVPISRPLMQQKMGEFLQHPVIQAAFESGYYDINKAADKMTELNDFDPEDFIATQGPEQQAGGESLIDPQRMINHAEIENQKLLQGIKLPGTPFSTPEHTMAHLGFMKNPLFLEKKNPNIINAFAQHIQWENAMQQARTEGLQANNQQPGQQALGAGSSIRNKETQGIMAGGMKATLPAKQVGPEGLPDLTGFEGFGPGR